MRKCPVAYDGSRRTTFAGTPIAVDDFQETERLRTPDMMPCRFHVLLHRFCGAGGVCDIDRVHRVDGGMRAVCAAGGHGRGV